MRQFTVGNRVIGEQSPPYLIAEIGVNHGGSIDLARRLIDLAREGGADAAKFQSYKADTLASKHSPAYWDTTKEPTTSQHQLFKKYDAFEPHDYAALARHCEAAGIDFLSTPFDEQAVQFLTPLMPALKVASADLTNVPLLRQVAATGKPVLLSAGASTLAELDLALRILAEAGAGDVAVLHCILNYPTAYQDANLEMITDLRRLYPNRLIGYSDHTLPDPAMTVLTTAYLKGARVLEKHFTLDKTLPGNDHYHAMDVNDLKTLRHQLALIRTLEGAGAKAPLPSEEPARQHARRSIVLRADVGPGTVLTPDLLTCKRPGAGISPLHWDEVVGRSVARALNSDHILQWDDLAPRAVAVGRQSG